MMYGPDTFLDFDPMSMDGQRCLAHEPSESRTVAQEMMQ